MNCLCCGKPLKENETNIGWHKRCIKSFFGTESLPEIELTESTLEALVSKSVIEGHTVPGVQKKLSLHLHSHSGKPRLTLVNYPTGYILKPQVEEFTALPEAEQLVMSMADKAKISTVPHALIRVGESLAYITKRADRIFSDDSHIKMLAMEDFCQLDERLTIDKYHGSYERCSKIILKYSSRSGIDMTELYMRIVFSYLVGNSDMHLKNFSLIETAEGSGEYVLSPAYDMLPVNVIMPEDTEQLALPLNGKKRNLRKKDFPVFADNCNISRASAQKMISKLVGLIPSFLEMCRQSFLPDDLKQSFASLIIERAKIFE